MLVYVGLLQLNVGVEALRIRTSSLTYIFTQNADYPAILPCERSKALLGRELTPEENSIRGTLVTGFTNQDFMFLDVFEGNVRLSLTLSLNLFFFVETNKLGRSLFWLVRINQEYVRKEVRVHPLGRLTAIPSDAAVSSSAVKGSLIPTALPPLPSADELAEPIPAQTYVWRSKDSYLEKELWSFDEFVKNNAYKWIGPEAKSSEYDAVDVVKERMNGEIASGGARP